MKIRLFIFLFGIASFCFPQSKQELIDSIIKVNELQSNCIGYACSESNQYNNFQKLKNLLTTDELNKLTNHENGVLRTYSILEIIDSEKEIIPKLFEQELNKNEEITTFQGCIIDSNLTYSEIYQNYLGKLQLLEYENNNFNLIETDSILNKLDSLVIFYPKDLYWLVYKKAFENRKYDESYLPRIKELAFEKNNSDAFDYLNKYYSERFSAEFSNYFKNYFPKAEFETENEIFYLHGFLEYLFDSENQEYHQIAVSKLKNEKSWRKDNYSWFKHSFYKYAPEVF